MVEWRGISGFEGSYEVSNDGNVRRLKLGKDRPAGTLVATRIGNGRGGHLQVQLRSPGRRQSAWVHRLVALAFLGPPPDGKTEVNHKDGDPSNNRVENLEWTSRMENAVHAREMGRYRSKLGIRRPHLSDSKCLAMRWLASRGIPATVIAKRAGCHVEHVKLIVAGKLRRTEAAGFGMYESALMFGVKGWTVPHALAAEDHDG